MEGSAAPTHAPAADAVPAAVVRRRHSYSVPALTSSAVASLKKSLRKLRPTATTPRKRQAAAHVCSVQPTPRAATATPPATGGDTPLERRRSTHAATRRRRTQPLRPSTAASGGGVGAAPPSAAEAADAAPTAIPTVAGASAKDDAAWRRQLTRAEYAVLRRKGTERPYSGAYDAFFPEQGHFVCAACAAPLYSATAKFQAGCGWPAFEACYAGAVDAVPDGHRTEIVCRACRGHLGHVFTGERLTATNERHCVNSVSVKYQKGAAPVWLEGKARRG